MGFQVIRRTDFSTELFETFRRNGWTIRRRLFDGEIFRRTDYSTEGLFDRALETIRRVDYSTDGLFDGETFRRTNITIPYMAKHSSRGRLFMVSPKHVMQ